MKDFIILDINKIYNCGCLLSLNTGIENPNTGFFAPVAGTLLLIIMASIIFVFNRKKTIFKRI